MIGTGGYYPVGGHDSMLRTIRRWETEGVPPSREHQRVLAQVYGLAVLTLFGPAPTDPSWPDIDLDETIARIRRTDLAASTLDDLAVHVDRLCTAYSTDDPRELIVDASRWLGEIDRALGGRTTSKQARSLHDAAAWLALLIGCLYNDLGHRPQAERMRSVAVGLATDAGDRRAVAWSHEMRVWFALTDNELHEALVHSEAGISAARDTDVAVQLYGQQAEAWARLGDRYQAQRALDEARRTLDRLPWPDNPRNHFTVDPPKFRKAVMRAARLLGDAGTAASQAEAIIAEGRRPDGSHRQPMRVADALGTMAVVAGEAGDVAGACELGHRALDVGRVSVPSLRLVVGEVLAVLPAREPAVRELADRVAAIG